MVKASTGFSRPMGQRKVKRILKNVSGLARCCLHWRNRAASASLSCCTWMIVLNFGAEYGERNSGSSIFGSLHLWRIGI